MNDCSELWCLATVDGGECKETFDTYDDFEEHFCQKHLDLALFACGARGCTAQFGTVLQIFRHLAICKRRGKKIKLLKCSENALESLTVLDRAKLLAVQCCVKRAKRESELTEVNGGVTSVESDVQCSLDGMGFHNSLDDDQIHVSIIRSPEIHQMEDIESGPKAIRRKRAVTPARQAAWRLKEQMLLEQEMKKKNKPPEKTTKDTQKKQKKLPVKITDKTRISALINDDPKMVKIKKRTPSYPQTESGPSRNSAFGTVNSNMFFESTKHIVSTESRPKLLLDKTQDPMSATQKQPKVFRSSLPAGPNNSSKIHDVSCGQLSPLDLTVTRPPDYSGFLRNPVINPILHERPLPVSFIPPQSASSFIQTSDGCQNNFKTNRTLTKTNLISQPRMFSTSEVDVQQKRSYMKPRGILRTREHALQNTAKTVGQTGQMDLDILSLFSKRLKDSKTLEHVEVSTLQVKQSEKPEGMKSIKSNVSLKKEASPVELSKNFKGNINLVDLSSDKDCGEEDNEYNETVPVILNLFSDQETAAPVLFDPRIIPGTYAPDESRSDQRNAEEKLMKKKEWKYAGIVIAMTQQGTKKTGSAVDAHLVNRDHGNLVYRNEVVAIDYDEEVEAEVLTDRGTGKGIAEYSSGNWCGETS